MAYFSQPVAYNTYLQEVDKKKSGIPFKAVCWNEFTQQAKIVLCMATSIIILFLSSKN